MSIPLKFKVLLIISALIVSACSSALDYGENEVSNDNFLIGEVEGAHSMNFEAETISLDRHTEVIPNVGNLVKISGSFHKEGINYMVYLEFPDYGSRIYEIGEHVHADFTIGYEKYIAESGFIDIKKLDDHHIMGNFSFVARKILDTARIVINNAEFSWSNK